MADSNTHETKIVINGDASVAVNALKLVRTNVERVLGVVKNAFSIVGKINWVIGGIQTIVEWTKKFHEWIHRAENEAKKLQETLAKSKYDTQVAHAAASYEKLIKRLAEVNRLEKERNEILEQRVKRERDLEDANIERKKQLEIAGLDPSDKNYSERKKAIERKYEIEASDARAARSGEDARRRVADLYRQANAKESEARLKEGEYNKQYAIANAAQERSFKAAMKARNGGDDEKTAAKEADEEWKRQYDKAKKIREDIDAILREAQSLRNKAAEVGSSRAANILNEANKQRIANEAKAEAAQKERDEAEKRSEREQKTETARRARMKEEELARLDPGSPNYDRKKKEIERKYEIADADANIQNAENAEDRATATEERKALLIRQGRERAEDVQARADEYMDRFAGEIDSWRPKNRLTAMGLDSGAAADRTAQDQAKNVQKLVELLTQQVDLTRNSNHYNNATFAP